MTTKLQKWGNSVGVRIPKYVLEMLRWTDGDEVIVSIDKDKIVISKKINDENK